MLLTARPWADHGESTILQGLRYSRQSRRQRTRSAYERDWLDSQRTFRLELVGDWYAVDAISTAPMGVRPLQDDEPAHPAGVAFWLSHQLEHPPA